MTENQKRLEEIKEKLDSLYQACAREYTAIVKEKKLEPYTKKCDRVTKEVAKKYAKFVVPLQNEYNELSDIVNEELEAARAAKYKTEAEIAQMQRKNKQKSEDNKAS